MDAFKPLLMFVKAFANQEGLTTSVRRVSSDLLNTTFHYSVNNEIKTVCGVQANFHGGRLQLVLTYETAGVGGAIVQALSASLSDPDNSALLWAHLGGFIARCARYARDTYLLMA